MSLATAQPRSSDRAAGGVVATDSRAAMAEAKRHFSQGVALYNDGNFSAALAEFEASFKAQSNPTILYNIGLTHKALFHYTKAIGSLQRYLNEAHKLSVRNRTEVEQVIGEINALLADITLTLRPDGASVVIDGEAAGNAPLKVQRIGAGHHVIQVSAEGYRPLQREFTLTAGVPMALDLTLDAIPHSGKVHIRASTRQALVRVDDRVLGLSPVDAEVRAGSHSLVVSAPEHVTYRSELVVTAGQSRSLALVLDPLPKRYYKKWWFWTLIGVAAAGAATALAVPLTVGKSVESPIIGTLQPGAGRVN